MIPMSEIALYISDKKARRIERQYPVAKPGRHFFPARPNEIAVEIVEPRIERDDCHPERLGALNQVSVVRTFGADRGVD